MEIYLWKKRFARKINILTDFLFNKTKVKYQKIIMLWKKKFHALSRTFTVFFSFPGLLFGDSIGFQDFPGPAATLFMSRLLRWYWNLSQQINHHIKNQHHEAVINKYPKIKNSSLLLNFIKNDWNIISTWLRRYVTKILVNLNRYTKS